jgi:protein-disulfide isomerase
MKARAFAVVVAGAALAVLPATGALAQRGGTVGRGGEARNLGNDRRDWTNATARTPEGGLLLGNPSARVKLVAYMSLTCPECAAFTAQGMPHLIDHVRIGRVSLEYRNFYRDGVDIAAAMLSRCAEPERYFQLTYNLYREQRNWLGRVNGLTAEQRQQLTGLSPLQTAQLLVPWLGLDAIANRYGVTARDIPTCLTQANFDQLKTVHEAGTAAGVQSTPTFFINGVRQEGATWATLDPQLRAALEN